MLRVGTETLVEGLLASVRKPLAAEDLVKRYREVGVLLIDNLWVLASRPQVSKAVRQLVEKRMLDGLLTLFASDLTSVQWFEKQPEMAKFLSTGFEIKLS